MATTYLTNTFSSPTNNYKWTLSVWVKRSGLGANQYIFQTYPSGQGYSRLYFDNTDKIQFDGEDTSAGNAFNLKTTRRFRDTNAWYHIVLKWDVTQGTASNRVKIYVNGVEEGNYGTETYPAQNTVYPINRDKLHNIGRHSSDTNTYFDGVMSHFHFTDGYSYDASTFGSTDSTTGEWKINTSPSITMGTNGFTILKDGMTITDQSSNSNNWALANGTLTKTEDNPSNVFATLNPLYVFAGNSNPVIERGNTVFNTSGNNANKGFFVSSLGMTQGSGKFYCEVKANDATRLAVGVCNKNVFLSSTSPDSLTNQAAISYYYSGNVYYDSNGDVTGGASYTDGDILGIALDMENYRLFFHKNGTYMNSGDPTTSTGNVLTFTNAAQYVQNHGEMFFFVSDTSTTGQAIASVNFGNGYFDTTAVASAGTNASNNGIFEYDVPAGYTALSTKGLNL